MRGNVGEREGFARPISDEGGLSAGLDGDGIEPTHKQCGQYEVRLLSEGEAASAVDAKRVAVDEPRRVDRRLAILHTRKCDVTRRRNSLPVARQVRVLFADEERGIALELPDVDFGEVEDEKDS